MSTSISYRMGNTRRQRCYGMSSASPQRQGRRRLVVPSGLLWRCHPQGLSQSVDGESMAIVSMHDRPIICMCSP